MIWKTVICHDRLLLLKLCLCFQLPFVTNASSFAGVLEKVCSSRLFHNTRSPLSNVATPTLLLLQVYFGTQHARIYLFANAFGILCANGMCSLISKPLLEEVGESLRKTSGTLY